MSKVLNILSGWKNYLIKNEVTEELARERMEVCMGSNVKPACEKYKMLKILNIKFMGCEICGCPVDKKVRSTEKDNKCDLNKWLR